MPRVSLEEHRTDHVMKCSPVKIDGTTVILCGSQRIAACVVCEAIAGKLCDWKTSNRKTCDAPLCDTHATIVGEDKDLCPTHAEAWKHHPGNRQGELPL